MPKSRPGPAVRAALLRWAAVAAFWTLLLLPLLLHAGR